jgi:hypothetical protein
MATFAFTQSVASCASLKSVRGKAPKARRGASVIRAANLMDTARSAGFTAFADAVEKNGLTGEINGGTFTVFAPTNEAMAAFTNPDGTHSTVDILKFHCIKGKIASKVRFLAVFFSVSSTYVQTVSKTRPSRGRRSASNPSMSRYRDRSRSDLSLPRAFLVRVPPVSPTRSTSPTTP